MTNGNEARISPAITGNKRDLFLSAAFAVFLMAMLWALIRTSAPAFSLNDSPETAASALSLGIGHAPAYPLYMLIAKAALLVMPGNPAFALSVFSALLSLFLLVIVFILAKRFSQRGALFAPVILAFIPVFWEQSSDAKGGIYILNLVLLCLQFLALDNLLKKYSLRELLILTFSYGLSLANHWPSASVMVFIPAIALFLAISEKKPRHAAAGLLFMALGLTPYLYLPIRAAAGPAMNIGNPLGAGAVMAVIFRSAYPAQPGLDLASVMSQTKAAYSFFASSLSVFAVIPLASLFRIKKDKRMLPAILLLAAAADITGVAVFNRTDALYEELISIFLLPSCAALCVLIPAGLEFFYSRLSGKWPRLFFSGAVITMALILGAEAYVSADRSGDFLGYDAGMNMLKTPPGEALLIVTGDFNVFPAQYLQIASAKRKDISVRRVNNADYAEKMTAPVWLSTKSEADISSYAGDYTAIRRGILFELAPKTAPGRPADPYQWRLYSYRGMVGGYRPRDSMENYLLSYYSSNMLLQSEELAAAGMTDKAKAMFDRAMSIKGFKSSAALERARLKVGR